MKIKFIDDINISVKGGDGGNAYINYKKNKIKTHQKSNNSNGGDGGDVYLLTDKNLNTLNKFLFKKKYHAKSGEHGKNKNRTGKKGKNITIHIPIGTKIYNKANNKIIGHLTNDKELLLVAKGGKHGICNIKNKLPQHYKIYNKNYGEKSKEKILRLELSLIANVGLIGLPNTGKSTFLNQVSSTKSKVGNYPFTTLSPVLGTVNCANKKQFTIADIPGLIKGASSGIGLGIKFLKHIEKCNLLLHFIDLLPQDNSHPTKNAIIIHQELQLYNKQLLNKPCWLIFNKIDLLPIRYAQEKTQLIISELKWKNKYYLVSAINHYGIKKLCLDITKFIYQ